MSEEDLRLLLVEDSEDDAALLLHALRRGGYQVRVRRIETAETFLEALDGEAWDLVISDYSLPQFSGPRALALFRERGVDIPFIVLSGAVGEEAAVALMKNGANDFVTKGSLDRVPLVVRRELADAAVRRRDRLAAAEKQGLQDQLLQAQKMEAIGVLTAGVAHDFNNLLGAIQIYTDLAQMKADKGQAIENELQHIMSATDRAAGLARQLLLFSRKQPLELVPLDSVPIVNDLLKMLRRIIGERVEVRTEIDPACRRILGDSGGIEQVIMNLAVNARDAMPDGGVLTIGLSNVEVVDSYCRGVLGARAGQFVRLSVQDSGCGMDAETQQRIFEPFYTTKGIGKGTGLGLSVVYGIVQHHRGWITVQSEPGAGTRFEVFFPPAEEAGAPSVGDTRPLEELSGHGERILLVEDEEGYRTVTAEALRANGYEVATASGAEDAERQLREGAGAFELLFSDVVLGDGDGLLLAGRARALFPHIRVLLTSGYTDDASRISEIRSAGVPFIAKPYSLPALLIVLRELLRPPGAGGRGDTEAER